MPVEDENIPAQQHGNQSDTVQHITFNNRHDADSLYKAACLRLLDMSSWGKTAKGPSSQFRLTDSSGNEVYRPAQQGDRLKIDMPGPGSFAGDGSDWVAIEHIQHEADAATDTEVTSVRVRPTRNPKHDSTETAHFFSNTATSTFLVKRQGLTVSAQVHGRNELPNTQAGNLIDKVRDVGVAVSAILGFAQPQWRHLIEGLLEYNAQLQHYGVVSKQD